MMMRFVVLYQIIYLLHHKFSLIQTLQSLLFLIKCNFPFYRFLYQKCLERICRAENNRHARNSKSGAETLSSFIASSRGSTNIPGEDQAGDDQDQIPDQSPDQDQDQGDVDVVLVTPSSSGKEGYERNPLQPTSNTLRGGQVVGTGEGTGAGTGTVARQRAGTMGSRHGSTGGTDAADPATRKSLTSRDSFRVNIASVSPRSSLTGGSGGSRQRSFTAESILHRAAFQSQSRSAKANSRENIDNQASSSSGDGQMNGQAYGQDHDPELEPSEEHSLESGYHHSSSPKRVVSPRLRSPSTHLAGDSIWPTAEPETIGNATRPEKRTTKNTLVGVPPSQVQLTSENVKKSSVTNGNRESGKGGERKEASDVTDKEVDKDDTLVNTVQVRTVSNTSIIAPVRTVSNTSIIAPVRTVSNTSIIAIARDDTANPTGEARGLRGRGKRAYSDIFFEMAKPEQVLGSHSLRHTHQRLNGKLVKTTEIIPDPEIQEKYGMYKSPTKPPKPQKSCTETCSYVIGKLLRGLKYFMKCLLHGLYEILVFGPPTEHHEDAQEGKKLSS